MDIVITTTIHSAGHQAAQRIAVWGATLIHVLALMIAIRIIDKVLTK